MSEAKVRALLVLQFEPKHVDAALKYYAVATEKFIGSEWDGVALQIGKFVESITKALMVKGGKPLPVGKEFKAGNQLRQMEQLTTLHDTLRLVIPKACIFVNELVNNRLGRHDTDIDPHEMDAAAVMPIASWVLAELVRFCSTGGDHAEASSLVLELTDKIVPFFEVIDGRTYVRNGHEMKADEVALLLLYHAYPRRLGRDELAKAVQRHGIARSSTYSGLGKLITLVDEDGGAWVLRAEGREKAEALLRELGA